MVLDQYFVGFSGEKNGFLLSKHLDEVGKIPYTQEERVIGVSLDPNSNIS